MEGGDMSHILIIWRGKRLNVDLSQSSMVEELGKKLQNLTSVRPDTMRLLVPQSINKTSKLITPFSDEHSNLSLKEAGIFEGKAIRMMGVFDDEVKEVSQSTMKSDLRIAGFVEEENRLKQRSVNRSRAPVKIPQGTYIFCDFRTLHIPGVELNPPPSEALRRMHILASDPGIIAIMNKHRWRVGVMTEMAPVGYVGISPKCLLGFNKNQGEEISLRLRTDDLKGFRKYETIKKTLLHELAHMVHSEHDANFFALDKQLNEEAVSLDWTKSRSQTLSGHRFSDRYEEDIDVEEINYSGQKVGGTWNPMVTARASSAAAAAAYRRRLEASASSGESQAAENAHLSFNKGNPSDASTVLDPDDGRLEGVQEKRYAEPGSHAALVRDKENKLADVTTGRREPYPESLTHSHNEPDPDDCLGDERMFEPDPDDCSFGEIMVSSEEPDPDDSQFIEAIRSCEPDSDIYISDKVKPNNHTSEPDQNDSVSSGRMIDEIQAEHTSLGGVSDSGDHVKEVLETGSRTEQDSESSVEVNSIQMEPDPDDHMEGSNELQRTEEPVDALWTRLQKAVKKLRSEVTPAESTIVLQTLFKIIRNVIDHPNEVKFQRLRKANPHFQRNVANYKAAMEVLTVVGFCEDNVSDETGRVEAYVVLKRNDPGLLWLAKSSLELLGHSALDNVAFQTLGFSSSSSPQQTDKKTNQHPDDGSVLEDGTNTDSTKITADNTATEESEDSGFDTDIDLSVDDLIKLVAEKEELLKLKHNEIKNMQDKVLRSYAEMENVLDRTKREAENTKKFAIQNFAKSLLDVADNLGRASSVVKESFQKIDSSKDSAGAMPLLKTLLDGVDMTDKQLAEVFRKFGVQKYDPINEKFDPNRHNAVFQIPDASKPPDTVAAVLKPGYMLYDRVIRPAEVGVTSPGAK